jgi:hypothetical protein
VEVVETWVGGTQAGLRGSRQLKGWKATLVRCRGPLQNLTPTHWGFLQQPDKQETSKLIAIDQYVAPMRRCDHPRHHNLWEEILTWKGKGFSLGGPLLMSRRAAICVSANSWAEGTI